MQVLSLMGSNRSKSQKMRAVSKHTTSQAVTSTIASGATPLDTSVVALLRTDLADDLLDPVGDAVDLDREGERGGGTRLLVTRGEEREVAVCGSAAARECVSMVVGSGSGLDVTIDGSCVA